MPSRWLKQLASSGRACSRWRSWASRCPRRSARARVHCARRMAQRDVVPGSRLLRSTGHHAPRLSRRRSPSSSRRCSYGDVDLQAPPAAPPRRRRSARHRWRGRGPAAVPAASPMAKHGPVTRAEDWPPWVIDAQRPATYRLSTRSGTIIRKRQLVEAAASRPRAASGTPPLPATWASTGQPLTPIVSVEVRAAQDVVLGQLVVARRSRRVSRMPIWGAMSTM